MSTWAEILYYQFNPQKTMRQLMADRRVIFWLAVAAVLYVLFQ